jgi:hypothetical protein
MPGRISLTGMKLIGGRGAAYAVMARAAAASAEKTLMTPSGVQDDGAELSYSERSC